MPNLNDVLSDINLYNAWIKVRENQGCAGIDGISIDTFCNGLWDKLEALANQVRCKSYRPKPLLRVEIDKPSGGIRVLTIPVIPDRILQTAVAMVLTPLFEAEFEDISFAYRKGRSVNQTITRIELLRNQGYQWVVDADIKSFFDQVDHHLLMQQVETLVKDKDILHLIGLWLKATVIGKKQRYQLKKGLSQGSPISPMLANLFLDQLDEVLLDNKYKIIRYADDFVILCQSEKRAKQAMQLSSKVLDQLRLCFNQSKTEITHFNRGFRFLGVDYIRSLVFKSKYPTKTTLSASLSQKSVIKNTPPKKDNQPSHLLTEMQQAFLDAGITPGLFVPKKITSSLAPSESAEPEALDIQAIDNSALSRYDPLLKTLYLLKHGLVLGKESERFVIRYKGDIQQEIPAIHVDQIMVFGNIQMTTQVMQFSLQQRIPVFLLSGKGRFYGVVDSFDTESVILHQQQFLQAANSQFCLKLSIAIVKGKLANSRVILRRFSRHHNAPQLMAAVKQLTSIINHLNSADNLDQLRGYEGSAARIYFQAFAAVIDPHWQFFKRIKKPPVDPVNAMLSFGYTLLFYNVYSLLRSRGLNPHVGSLHPLRQGHPALVSDMMEEFRAIIVDSVVFNIALNNKLKPDDFTLPDQEGDACLLNKDARKFFITQLEKKLNAQLRHPVSGLNLDYRRCIEHQINHLVAVIRQSTNSYQAMVLR